MENADAKVRVGGDFLTDGQSSDGSLTAGKLYIKGDFYQSNETSDSSFRASGSHMTILNGSGARRISPLHRRIQRCGGQI